MDLLVGPLAHSRMLKVHNVTAGVVLVSPGWQKSTPNECSDVTYALLIDSIRRRGNPNCPGPINAVTSRFAPPAAPDTRSPREGNQVWRTRVRARHAFAQLAS
jgi:hypothetical protein